MKEADQVEYASTVARTSYDWYKTAAIRSRRLSRGSDIAIVLASAAIPLAVAILPSSGLISAILGFTIAITTSTKSIYHWHENYLRFSRAREMVDAELRRFTLCIAPYSGADKASRLVEAIIEIESEEMSQWLQIARNRGDAPTTGDEEQGRQ